MVRKPAQKRSDGWVYVVQWEARYREAKIGFSTDLKQRLNDFLTYSSDKLVVLKVFRGDREKEGELHLRFESKRINGEWFRLDERVKHFFKTACPCNTREARQEFGSFQKERIIWRPLILQASTRLENAHCTSNLPRYVNNAKLYTLWAIRDLNENDFLCTPNAIITHPTNNGVAEDWTMQTVYDEKTLYNCISSSAKDGLIVKGEDKLYALTSKGMAELEKAELKMLELKEKRKSARSVCPRMP